MKKNARAHTVMCGSLIIRKETAFIMPMKPCMLGWQGCLPAEHRLYAPLENQNAIL